LTFGFFFFCHRFPCTSFCSTQSFHSSSRACFVFSHPFVLSFCVFEFSIPVCMCFRSNRKISVFPYIPHGFFIFFRLGASHIGFFCHFISANQSTFASPFIGNGFSTWVGQFFFCLPDLAYPVALRFFSPNFRLSSPRLPTSFRFFVEPFFYGFFFCSFRQVRFWFLLHTFLGSFFSRARTFLPDSHTQLVCQRCQLDFLRLPCPCPIERVFMFS